MRKKQTIYSYAKGKHSFNCVTLVDFICLTFLACQVRVTIVTHVSAVVSLLCM